MHENSCSKTIYFTICTWPKYNNIFVLTFEEVLVISHKISAIDTELQYNLFKRYNANLRGVVAF